MAEVRNYPSNSNKSKEAEERKINKPVVKGAAKSRKKSFGTKFAETFVSDDASDVKGYILSEVIVPSVKSLISEMVTSGIEMILYGETRGHRRYSTNSKTSYSSYYHNVSSTRERGPGDTPRATLRGIYNFDEVILDNREDADAILDTMLETLEEYKRVSVADLYDLADLESTWADQKYGWKNLDTANVVRLPGEGWLIKLPKAREL